MSDSSRPHGLQPTRLLRPRDFPGKSTGILPSHKKECSNVICSNLDVNSYEKKRRERQRRKGNGEKEKFHLNTEFQRIAMRDKKAFLSDQCKEIEENNTMGKTGDLFKKIRNTKGTFHAKMGSIKDRNGMGLTEA